MSSTKRNLKKFQSLTSGNMASASLTSAVTNIELLDNVGVQINFTGSPVGTFEIQVSADYDRDAQGNVITAGNWIPISFPTTPAATGSSGQIYLDMTQLSAPWIRTVYTRTSGTGSLNVFITAKMI